MKTLFPFCVLLLSITAQAQNIRYVTPTGSNANPATATSWATSTTNLQGAINSLSASGGQVWVAVGTYKPGGATNTTNRSLSFQMQNNVAMYGGFTGTETALNGRPAGATSTLSGDINSDNVSAGNCYHVIKNPTGLNQTALLDGFVITGGNANSTSPDNVGGGMYNNGASPRLVGCTFVGNVASVQGGGLYTVQGSPRLERCLIQNNFAPLGAGISNDGTSGTTSLTALNCLFLGNIASNNGGAVYNSARPGNCTPLFVNCTFRSNVAIASGAALYNLATAGQATGLLSGTLTNCLLWDNGGSNTLVNQPASNFTQIGYSLLEPTVTGFVSLTGNQTTSTLPFMNAFSPVLTPVTLAVNGGDPASTTANLGALDLAGNPRLVNNRVDMGCAEFQGLTRLYVRAGATGTNSGESWVNAFTDLQAALALNFPGVDEIWVANGTYRPTNTGDRTISFVLRNEHALYGGFVGNETSLSQRPPITYASPSGSILSGDLGVLNNPTDNSYRVVEALVETGFTFDGFVVTGGVDVRTSGNINDGLGGGMRCSGVTPKVRNCRFVNNRSLLRGGGLTVFATRPDDPTNSVIPIPELTNCVFESNTGATGGGVACFGATLVDWQATLTNCLFAGNSATAGGGFAAIGLSFQVQAILRNCTFANNQAALGAAVLDSAQTGNPVVTYLTNSILVNNGQANAIARRGSSALVQAGFNLFEPGVTSFTDFGGNVFTSQNPFAILTPFQLANCSPAINIGDPSGNFLPAFDGNNQPRVVGQRVDVGAFEHQSALGQVATIRMPVTSATACTNGAFQLAASVAGIPASTVIRWFQNNILLPDQTTPLLSLTSATGGTYRIEAQTGCGVQSATLTLSVVSVAFPNGIATLKDGNWNDSSVWQCGRVPLVTDAAWIRHAVTLPANVTATTFRLNYDTGGRIIYNNGARIRLGQ